MSEPTCARCGYWLNGQDVCGPCCAELDRALGVLVPDDPESVERLATALQRVDPPSASYAEAGEAALGVRTNWRAWATAILTALRVDE